MFAVVVLRSNPSEHCVVPENYIYGFEDIEAELKTWGANKNHDHLVYWSRELLNDNVTPCVITHPPNFSLPKCTEFPPKVAACCFLARVKRFFRSFDQAIEFRNRFRPVLPVIHNVGRLKEQPAPPNEPYQEENDAEETIISDHMQNDSNEQQDEIDHEESETKFVLPTVQLNNSDDDALQHLFNGAAPIANDISVESAHSESDISNECSTNSQEDSIESVVLGGTSDGKIVYKKLKDNTVEVTTIFDDDLVMKYVLGQEVRVPVLPVLKANDLLSGNQPFHENVSVFFFSLESIVYKICLLC